MSDVYEWGVCVHVSDMSVWESVCVMYISGVCARGCE